MFRIRTLALSASRKTSKVTLTLEKHEKAQQQFFSTSSNVSNTSHMVVPTSSSRILNSPAEFFSEVLKNECFTPGQRGVILITVDKIMERHGSEIENTAQEAINEAIGKGFSIEGEYLDLVPLQDAHRQKQLSIPNKRGHNSAANPNNNNTIDEDFDGYIETDYLKRFFATLVDKVKSILNSLSSLFSSTSGMNSSSGYHLSNAANSQTQQQKSDDRLVSKISLALIVSYMCYKFVADKFPQIADPLLLRFKGLFTM